MPALDFNLHNLSSNTVELKKVYDLAQTLEFELDENSQIEGNKTKRISIPTFQEKKKYDFYTLTPVVEYIHNGESHSFYMHGVV